MRRILRCAAIATAFGTVGVFGCGYTDLGGELQVSIPDVQAIQDNTNLDAQEKRDQLAALGFEQPTINALLRDERLGNQFGGTLETAIAKVEGNALRALTPDEVQHYGDATGVTTFSDDAAYAIAEFFSDRGFLTLAELEADLDDPGTEVPPEIDETDLRGVFLETDLEDVRDALP